MACERRNLHPVVGCCEHGDEHSDYKKIRGISWAAERLSAAIYSN